jgi:hypothetical protein
LALQLYSPYLALLLAPYGYGKPLTEELWTGGEQDPGTNDSIELEQNHFYSRKSTDIERHT